MIKYFQNKDIDKNKWDDCIQNSFNGLIYAYSWYLDIMSPGWEALIENDYERVFPLTAKKKSGINYLCQPFFTQQLGIFSKGILNEKITEEFISKIPSKYKLIEINLNVFNKIDDKKNHFFSNKNIELDLIPDYNILYNNYSENTKRNLKIAGKSQLIIRKDTDIKIIVDLFRKYRGLEIETLKDKDYKDFIKLVNLMLFKKNAHIWSVCDNNGKLYAGAVFIESNKKVIFIFSATSKAARENRAMTFLIDQFIRENAQRNLILDFEGSNNSNLARFYKGFGSTECTYLQYKNNKLPYILSKSITFIKWFKKQI